MKKFIKYFDNIKADEELKDKTIKFIRMSSAKNIEKQESKKQFGEGILTMKKLVGTLMSITVLALVAIGGFNIYNKPVAYVSFDINPSIELGLNFMNRVVSTKGINDDGIGLLAKTAIKNMSVEDAVQVLVKEADKDGYIYQDGSTVVALTALADKEEDAIKIQDRIRDKVEALIDEDNLNCIVYADHSNLQLRTLASENNISPGKYRLIEMLQAMDSSITVEQYRNARVTEIMLKAHDLMGIANKAQVTEKNKNMINDTVQELLNRNQIQENNEIKNNVIQDENGTATQQQTQTNNSSEADSLQQQTQQKTQIKTQIQTN
ncbi:MAG: hypothetical protein PHQ32_04530 [Firmicutes bacterium]|nr:hypothetical protein [Bacillota bacterium]